MTLSNDQLSVVIDDSLSIDDLVTRQSEGFSVLRSAHIGNLSPYNLALAQAGIPLLSVDHTITGIDSNYFPELFLSQAGNTTIAPLGRLVCRTVSPGGDFLDTAHLTGVRSALPDATVYSNTSYLRTNENVTGAITAIAVREMPAIFNRLALPDGTTRKNSAAAYLVARIGILQLLDDPRAEVEAVLMPNIVDIMANFVIEALASEKATQYHVSGPDMYKYIGGIMPELQFLYQCIREQAHFGSSLPADLEVRLIPAAEAKFATTNARQPQLDALLETYDAVQAELSVLSADKRRFFTGEPAPNQNDKAQFAQNFRQRQSALETEMIDRIAAIPELFTEPGRTGFISQYDALHEGGVYVPDTNRKRSMADLAGMSRFLRKFTRRLEL